ncbi:hypothetical protein ACWDA7_36285 [Streptomyces sp. NPDC001156]
MPLSGDGRALLVSVLGPDQASLRGTFDVRMDLEGQFAGGRADAA